MLLIATDEAGYGPKLGPLVIAATAWKIPPDANSDQALNELFTPLRGPHNCGGMPVRVDDSKAVYKPNGGLKSNAGMGALHAAVSASHHWCKRDATSFQEMLPTIVPDDLTQISAAPWLTMTSDESFLNEATTRELLQRWRQSGVQLIDVRARVITAESFNLSCSQGANKADLLSESTLTLVRNLFTQHGSEEANTTVYCDRHGGRRYYGSVLQHVFPDARLSVRTETKSKSAYQLTQDASTIDIQFNVKGDSFTPVALASMHAKYLRERFMQSLNRFFAQKHQSVTPLKPTAGYPVDADRFLEEISDTIAREGIDRTHLVRSR